MDAEMDSVITNTGVSGSTLMKQESDEIQFVSTQRNQQKIVYRGRDREVVLVSSILTLMPQKSSEPGCRVDACAFYHQQQLNELKRLAAGDPRPVLEIYDELASNASTSLETAAYFPTWEQARNTIDTHHFRPGGRICSLPLSRQQRNLPTNDILIFATEDGVRLLAQSNCWCGDGTFKIVPSWYQQLFTLHVFLRRKLLPVVYCLTVRKDLPTYSRIFKDREVVLVSSILTLMPQKSSEPGCRVDACAFYHQQQLNELKRLAAGDPRPVLEIYDELASNASTSLETAAYFPTWEQARNTIDTHHFRPGGRICSLPLSRQQRNLPTNDILIFATEDGVRLLAQSNCWCGDGTFKIVPSWYQQLFTLHVFLRRKLLPVVYCLTVRKDLPTYSRIF
ncbi:hypothetical protein T03_9775, partial [Trichinella britovi]